MTAGTVVEAAIVVLDNAVVVVEEEVVVVADLEEVVEDVVDASGVVGTEGTTLLLPTVGVLRAEVDWEVVREVVEEVGRTGVVVAKVEERAVDEVVAAEVTSLVDVVVVVLAAVVEVALRGVVEVVVFRVVVEVVVFAVVFEVVVALLVVVVAFCVVVVVMRAAEVVLGLVTACQRSRRRPGSGSATTETVVTPARRVVARRVLKSMASAAGSQKSVEFGG